MNDLTPMLKQYLSIKGEHPDAILFFRLGDFYEMFFEDAKEAAGILGIALTHRGVYQGEKVPMCGVPYHACRSYMGKLLDRGLKVALCEQVEEAQPGKGIVRREVLRVVTPGSVVDEKDLDPGSHLFMAACASAGRRFGIAFLELSTGEFRVTERDSFEAFLEELGRIAPDELVVPSGGELEGRKELVRYRIEILGRDRFRAEEAERLLKEHLEIASLGAFGCGEMTAGVTAAAALVRYLSEIQRQWPPHVRDLVPYHTGDHMVLDTATMSHLELLKTMRRQSFSGSLAEVLDRTVTPMGSRLLKQWIAYPLLNLEKIEKRLEAVGFLLETPSVREALKRSFAEIHDIERLNGRISLERTQARDLLALRFSLERLPAVKERLGPSESALLRDLGEALDPLEDVASLIREAIHEAPPAGIEEGGIIKEGYDAELDRLLSIGREGKDWIAGFALSEQRRTGIPNLKVGFNRVYGYYIEVTRSHLPLVPAEYVRKQTVVNGERFISEPLKEKEDQVLGAEERRCALERRLFEEVRRKVAAHTQRIRRTAQAVAALDVLTAMAETAERNRYVRPRVSEGMEIEISEGRHPVIERLVKEEAFVPNDIRMDGEENQVLIVTGPNMAGKSTILRQTALIALMAQIGSFVPAARATIGIVDRIFTRVGASDDLSKGQSTFMVEMTETANILRHATPRSLVILDEIGRGTSTYDGLSIAWAVAEFLHDHGGKGVRTLFATHYHELTEIVSTKARARNFNIAVREWKDRIVFLRKLVPGGTSRSYGIQVARIAGIPEEVLRRAREVLEDLETEDGRGRPHRKTGRRERPAQAMGPVQLSLFGQRDERLLAWIRGLDPQRMTPLDALLELQKMKDYVEKESP